MIKKGVDFPNEIWELIINSTDDNVALRRLSCTSKDMRALMCEDIAQRYLKYALLCRKEGHIEKMFVYFKRSASLGNAEAMFRIGYIVGNGNIPPFLHDERKLIQVANLWIDRAAICGHKYAIVDYYMRQTFDSSSVFSQIDLGDDLYLKGLYLRYMSASNEYADFLKLAVEEQNNEYALKYLINKPNKILSYESVLKFAEEGSLIAQNIIIISYLEKNSEEHVFWFKKMDNQRKNIISFVLRELGLILKK